MRERSTNPDPTKIIKPYAILPRSDAHQGKFLGLINVGSGLRLVDCDLYRLSTHGKVWACAEGDEKVPLGPEVHIVTWHGSNRGVFHDPGDPINLHGLI